MMLSVTRQTQKVSANGLLREWGAEAERKKRITLVGEAQPPQHALHALELVLEHDALRALDLLPQQLDLVLRVLQGNSEE